eukprot:1798392-Pyramimonas_sp.AAC.1
MASNLALEDRSIWLPTCSEVSRTIQDGPERPLGPQFSALSPAAEDEEGPPGAREVHAPILEARGSNLE